MEKNEIANIKQGLLGTRDWDSFQAILRKAHGMYHRSRKPGISHKDKRR